MKLSKAKASNLYLIMDNQAKGRPRARLDSLGLVAGTAVYVIQKSYAGLIINIKGSRLALSKDVSDMLEVVPAVEAPSTDALPFDVPAVASTDALPFDVPAGTAASDAAASDTTASDAATSSGASDIWSPEVVPAAPSTDALPFDVPAGTPLSADAPIEAPSTDALPNEAPHE